MEVVEYWHGTIKNYGYDGDVSELRRTPTWRAKCRMLGSGRPLRFEH